MSTRPDAWAADAARHHQSRRPRRLCADGRPERCCGTSRNVPPTQVGSSRCNPRLTPNPATQSKQPPDMASPHPAIRRCEGFSAPNPLAACATKGRGHLTFAADLSHWIFHLTFPQVKNVYRVELRGFEPLTPSYRQ